MEATRASRTLVPTSILHYIISKNIRILTLSIMKTLNLISASATVGMMHNGQDEKHKTGGIYS
jgi:hypothetical protein